MNRDQVRAADLMVCRATWLILPVVLAVLGHVAVLKTNFLGPLAIPVDGGTRWRGRPVFGANKTWRGVAVMTGLTALASAMLDRLARQKRWRRALELRRSARVNAWMAGAVYGLAYCLAELPNSFMKRRPGISPGAHSIGRGPLQYVVDQADSVAGCLIALRLLYRSNPGELLTAFALGMTIHISIDQLIYAIGVKSRAARV